MTLINLTEKAGRTIVNSMKKSGVTFQQHQFIYKDEIIFIQVNRKKQK